MVKFFFDCIGIAAIFGFIFFVLAVANSEAFPECYDDEEYPVEYISHVQAKGASGNSHQRRIARRELARAEKLGKA